MDDTAAARPREISASQPSNTLLLIAIDPVVIPRSSAELVRGQPRQAAATVGLLSRLDVPTLLELLATRLKDWNRFYHDMTVRQIAFGAATDRGRTLLELLEILDPLVLPQALDEIGMSGDRTAAPPLLVIAKSGEAQGRPPLLQLKAVESLGRLREPESVSVLRNLLEAKKMWKWINHRELRIAAAQALAKIDAGYGATIVAESGLEPAELAIAPLDSAPACPWVRQRRYERVALRKPLSATIGSSWGKSSITIRASVLFHRHLVLHTRFDAHVHRHLMDSRRVEGCPQADRLGKLSRSIHRHAVQRLAPPVIPRNVQPRNRTRLIHQLGGLLFQRHATHQIRCALLRRQVGVEIRRLRCILCRG